MDDDDKYIYNTDEEAENQPSTSKRKRGKNHFNDEWKTLFSWVVAGKSEIYAKCIYCKCEINISVSGITDVKRHMKTAKHQSNMKAATSSKNISTFFSTPTEPMSSYRKAAAAEATFAYHTVQHTHSYNSANCSSSLYSTMFPDSKIASDFSCGRTKCSRIVTNVLAKHCQKKIIDDLKNLNIPFGIATDASNKGNIKMFPLVVRYFLKEDGIQTKVLNFFNSSSEASQDIANCLISKLQTADLDLKNVNSFGADNANVNFGRHQSVFTELRKVNPDIIDMGCICHMISNSFKNGIKMLKFDLEYIVIKIYSEFSSHTKRKHELMEFYEFCDVEYSEMLRHVSTRWLSLLPAVDRLYKNFAPIKAYFNSKSSNHTVLLSFLNNELAEAYLGLISNIGSLLQNVILRFEEDGPVLIELFEIMTNLRISLQSRLDEKFFGLIAKLILDKSDNLSEKDIFLKRATCFLEKIIEYIETRYSFNQNKFELLSFFKLEKNLNFEELLNIVKAFPMSKLNLDIDVLFDEFTHLKQIAPTLVNHSYENKWILYFKDYNAPNLLKIVQFVFAIPHSNAMTERIFNLMFQAWRAERSRLNLENIEAEIMVKQNFKKTCKEFYKYVMLNDDLLRKIKGSEKYN